MKQTASRGTDASKLQGTVGIPCVQSTATKTVALSKRNPRQTKLAVAAIIGLLLVVLAVKTVLYLVAPTAGKLPLLTQADFERAKQTWESSGIDSYDMDVAFQGGANREEIHLEVRSGEVMAITKNGKPPSQQQRPDEWSIPHQFDMIAEDLATEARGGFDFEAREGVHIVLRAEFDPETGRPIRYIREPERGRSPLHSHWTVTSFEVVE